MFHFLLFLFIDSTVVKIYGMKKIAQLSLCFE